MIITDDDIRLINSLRLIPHRNRLDFVEDISYDIVDKIYLILKFGEFTKEFENNIWFDDRSIRLIKNEINISKHSILRNGQPLNVDGIDGTIIKEYLSGGFIMNIRSFNIRIGAVYFINEYFVKKYYDRNDDEINIYVKYFIIDYKAERNRKIEEIL